MGYFSSLMKALADSLHYEDPVVIRAISNILSILKIQKELRFFIDGTRNYGHQAATVQMMKRLIRITGFEGKITMIYAETNMSGLDNTISKLALLLPGLDPNHVGTTTIEYGSCKDIKFLNYSDRTTLADKIRFGFTAGADDMAINFATELKVDYFVRLQPYMWDEERPGEWGHRECSRIETPAGKFFYPVDAYPSYRTLPYKFSTSESASVDDAIWSWYGIDQTFDFGLRNRTRNAQVVYEACQRGTGLHVWPIYGIHQFQKQIAEIAMNLVITAFQAQHIIQKPIVILFMNAGMDIGRLESLLLPFASDLERKSYALEYFKAALADRYHEFFISGSFSRTKLDAFVAEIATQVRPLIDTGARLTFLTDYGGSSRGYTDISDILAAAIAGATDNEVIAAIIGPVPVDVYNYLYANSMMPGVFEGQHSSSLVISLGRPFLQILRNRAPIKHGYPTIIAGKDYSAHAFAAADAALQLTGQQYQMYLGKDSPGPKEYLAQLAKTSDFIVAVQNPSSVMCDYFKTMGRYFQMDIHDKCLLGLIAQVLSF